MAFVEKGKPTRLGIPDVNGFIATRRRDMPSVVGPRDSSHGVGVARIDTHGMPCTWVPDMHCFVVAGRGYLL